MTTFPGSLVVEKGLDIERLCSILGDKYEVEAAPAQQVRRAFLDSFDGRIAGSGCSLEAEDRGEGLRLIWRAADTGRVQHSVPIGQPPRFATDLPTGKLRDSLAKVLDVRAVQAIADLKGEVRPFRVLNGEGKTVLRLELDESHVVDAEARKVRSLKPRLRVVPMRGYDGAHRTVLEALSAIAGLEPEPRTQVQEALAALGRRHGENPTNLRIGLEPSDSAIDGMRELLASLLKTLTANESGIVDDLDIEFVHDFRVAVRRMRTLLGEIRDVLPAGRAAHIRGELRWLAEVTGGQRDLDVQIHNMDAYRALIAEPLGEALGPLEAHVRARRQAARAGLLEALRSTRYFELVDGIRRLVREPGPPVSMPGNAFLPLRRLADRRIWKCYRRILKAGRAIGPESGADALHELRKDCKKLRYMLEFFRDLHRGEDTASALRVLRRLQNCLGEFQDFTVHAEALGRSAQEMMESDGATARTLMAIGVLIEEIGRKQAEVLANFAARFAEFDRKANRELFRALYAPPAGIEARAAR